MRLGLISLLAVLAQLNVASAGVDWIETSGPLLDDDFYRLISCAARPGKPCRAPFVRWRERDARDLTIAIAATGSNFPASLARAVDTEINRVVAEINSTGSGVHLRRVGKAADADIKVFLPGIRQGERISGTGLKPLDGAMLEAAHVQIWWNGSNQIIRGAIVVARDVDSIQLPSILLEEVFQSLGFLTDIRNPWYESRSIVSQDSDAVRRLMGQDVMALRRHYPPANRTITKDQP